MGKIINFVRHKTAGWAGVIYLDKKGQKRVNNGCFDWPLTHMNYVRGLIRVDAIKRGGDTCDPR